MSKLPTTRKKVQKQIKSFNKVSTTERQWMVLSMIQRGKWIGTVHIQEQLKLSGFNVTLRTVQRDLVALSERFLIEHNNSNPQGWRWRDDAPLQSMPNMNLSQAVAFRMVKENLAQLLPPAILKELHPWFDLADQQLKEENSMQSWLDKVHIEPPTLSLIPPELNTKIQTTIYQAVFEQRQLQASYTSTSKNQIADYLLNPLALVQRGAIIYLLATKIEKHEPLTDISLNTSNCNEMATDKENDIRMFSLHRFEHVELLEEASTVPEGFSLNKFIESGAMGFQEKHFNDLPNNGKQTKVTLTFDMQAYRALNESKLSHDQILTVNFVEQNHKSNIKDQSITDDLETNFSSTAQSFTVKATVNLTRQLVWWLRGFGKTLLKAEPNKLWQVVQDEIRDG